MPSRLDLDAAVARARTGDDGCLPARSGPKSFVRRGGKLLLWHGWSDGTISPLNTINYYNDVMSTSGMVRGRDQIRLFMAPGVQHCGWRRRGMAGRLCFGHRAVGRRWQSAGTPHREPSARRSGDTSRPLCPYPQIATYTGQGSSDEAGSFVCKATSAKHWVERFWRRYRKAYAIASARPCAPILVQRPRWRPLGSNPKAK